MRTSRVRMSGAFFTIGMTASFEVSFRNKFLRAAAFGFSFRHLFSWRKKRCHKARISLPASLPNVVSMWFTDSPQYQIPDRYRFENFRLEMNDVWFVASLKVFTNLGI